MPYCEGQDGREQVEGHGGNLTSMLVPVADGKPRHHHVWCVCVCVCGGGGGGGGGVCVQVFYVCVCVVCEEEDT